jgi:hypothetical protein
MLTLVTVLLFAWGILCLVALMLRLLPPSPLTQTTIPHEKPPVPVCIVRTGKGMEE